MPKKFGINTKSEEARDKKKQAKTEKRLADEERKESLKWADDDASRKAKEERKKEKEEKKQRELERKQENRKLADEELKTLEAAKPKKEPPKKMTQAQIAEMQRQSLLASLKSQVTEEEKAIEEQKFDEDINPNHIRREEIEKLAERGVDSLDVRGLDEALNVLDDKVMKHPEKKAKKAWDDYVEARLPDMKKEYPTLKRSQLLNMLHKEWEKAPENPFNQRVVDYNVKISQT